MNTENRDFVIERLERQLKEKETELDDIKNNLRDSILREIRSDLKHDLDFNNRLTKLEQKVQALNNNVNGVMDELLDQKSMIRSLKELSVSSDRKQDKKTKPSEKPSGDVASSNAVETTVPVTPKVYRPEPRSVAPQANSLQAQNTSPSSSEHKSSRSEGTGKAGSSSKPFNPKVSVRSAESEQASGNSRATPSSNMRFNVREVPSVKQPEMPVSEPRSEYIIAETDEERQMRLNSASQPETESCDYIVAEEDKPSSCNDECSEYETVEAREDEDAVVVTTRRK